MAKDVNETPEYDWPDVEVMGNFLSEEAQAVLRGTIPVMQALHRETPAREWQLAEFTGIELLHFLLAKHPVQPQKDGHALVYARGKKCGTIHRDGKTIQNVQRAQNAIEEITAIAVDVDGSDKARRVAKRIHELGWFAVVYTTHSHAEKKTSDGDRFRLVIFLQDSIEFPREKDARRAAVENYRARYVGLCEMLGLTDIDETGMRLHQMQYTPRRASKDAVFEHYVIAGAALDWTTVPKGDPTKYTKATNAGKGRKLSDKGTATNAYLSDGFNNKFWYSEGGHHCLMDRILEDIGWDVRGEGSGGWWLIQCPNAAQHSDPEDDTCGLFAGDDSWGFNCFHNHCAHLSTFEMLALIEEAILAGEIALPDEYTRFSEMLCDPVYYPDDVFDGVPEDFGGHLPVKSLRTADAVQQAFDVVLANEESGEDDYIRLYAGVAKGGSKTKPREKLAELMAEHTTYKHNDLTRFEKAGREFVEEEEDREVEGDRRQAVAKADPNAEGVNVSMDSAAPLGSDMKTSLGTLRRRYAPADVNGKYRIVRRPDLSAMGSEFDSTVVYYLPSEFVALHEDRPVINKKGEVEYPAEIFLKTEPRKSAVVFGPPPVEVKDTALNTYMGRLLTSKKGDWDTIEAFILDVICDGDQGKYNWLILWMAHMVQRPGEKPGTAVVAHGPGGIGKGTFARILMRLAAPHAMYLEKEGHVTGQFAGDHLSVCVLACVTEAVFGKSPKVASELKAMIDSPTVSVEAKGLPVHTAMSFLRMYFDSNEKVPIRIEGNGSERRYFVLKVSDARQKDSKYFTELRTAIDGDEMAAFLHYLELYSPADAGFTWNDVREAPETPERLEMAGHSMNPAMRRLKEVIEDGEVTMRGEDGARETYLAKDGKLRVPRAHFRGYIGEVADARNSDETDIAAMYTHLRPKGCWSEGRGKVGLCNNVRWVEFEVEGTTEEAC